MTSPDESVPHVPGYEIVGLLGRGGCGTVYVATQQGLSRKVALKVLSSEALPSKSMRRRFLREAQALASVRHPGVVEILAFQGDGVVPFLAMELLPGGTLRNRIDRAPLGLGPEVSLRLARELLEALDALHEAGMIHRDVKPTNVLYREDGQAVLGDLGVVHVNLEGATRMTGSHELLGTLAYFAPELYRNREPTARSDLFALGVTLFEAITGQHPTEFRPFSKDFQPVDPRALTADCPAALAGLVHALLSADPERRPATAPAALDLLDHARPVPLMGPRRRARGAPAMGGAGVALAIGLGLGLAAGVWLGGRGAPGSRKPEAVKPGGQTIPAPRLAAAFGPATLLGVAPWPQPALVLDTSADLRVSWIDATGAPLEAGREIAVVPGRAAIPVPPALVQARRGMLRLAPAIGRPYDLDVDLAALAPAGPDPLMGVAVAVGNAEPTIRTPGGNLTVTALARLTSAGCVACIAPRPTSALEATLSQLARLPGVRPIVQIPAEESGQPAPPPAGAPWGSLFKRLAGVMPAQVMVMPRLFGQDLFSAKTAPRPSLPAELDAAWRRDLRDISPDFTLLPPPIALSVAALGVDVPTAADRPLSVVAPLLHDNTLQWDQMGGAVGRILGAARVPTFVWLSQHESAKDSFDVYMPYRREGFPPPPEEMAMARSLVLARRAFPRSTIILDLAYEISSNPSSAHFVLVERTINALHGMTCTGSLPTVRGLAPWLTPARQLVALAFTGGDRNAQMIFSDLGRCVTRFTPAAPGMLCVISRDGGARNLQRLHLDTSPIDIEMEGGLAVYEELGAVTATKLDGR